MCHTFGIYNGMFMFWPLLPYSFLSAPITLWLINIKFTHCLWPNFSFLSKKLPFLASILEIHLHLRSPTVASGGCSLRSLKMRLFFMIFNHCDTQKYSLINVMFLMHFLMLFHFAKNKKTFLMQLLCSSCSKTFSFSEKSSSNCPTLTHGVWESQKKSPSTLRAKRATFTFWVDKS